jgi:cytidylate kinase
LLISVSGPPGSGKTTAARRAAAELDLELVLGGQVFRTMAAEHGMSLADFGIYAAREPTVDAELDRRLAERAALGDVVLESRLAGWIVRNENLDGLAVFVECDETTRAERVALREGITVEQALAENVEREKIEHERYFALYGIDINDLSIYDLIVDSGALDADDVAAAIVRAARVRGGSA